MEKSSRAVSAAVLNSLMLSVMVLWLLQLGFGGITVAVADDPYATYCSPDMYFKGDHDVKANIKLVLQNLLEKTTASAGSDIESKLQYPSADPVVYGAASCERSPPEACGRCLRMAKKLLLHGCYHSAGAEFYSELCYLRYEIYNFIS